MKPTFITIAAIVLAVAVFWMARPWTDAPDQSLMGPESVELANGTRALDAGAMRKQSTEAIPEQGAASSVLADANTSVVLDGKANIKATLDAQGPLVEMQPSLAYALASELFKCQQFDTLLSSPMADKLGSGSHEFVKTTSERCTGLSIADKWKFLEYLDHAARMGNVDARIMYAAIGSRSVLDHAYALKNPEETALFKQTAMNYLNQAARAGSAEAMRALAHAFEAGVITGENRASAVAMMTAAQRRAPLAHGAGAIAALSATLTAAELAQAKQIAESFLNECCASP